jgi:bifunctional non-homologous end joining protein LigD
VTLTHPDRVLFPGLSITKADLAAYYESVAEAMLPHLADRPLMLVRCPAGFGKPCFYQKHPAGTIPESLRRVPIKEKGKTENYVIAEDLPGLISLVQISALEVHVWGSRYEHLEKPDRIVFDLDPGSGVAWSAVIDAAQDVRERLSKIGLTGFVKTTGGKGLHVVVPVRPVADWDEVKLFAETMAAEVVSSAPDRYVGKMTKSLRANRIYVDYLRNGRGATSVAAYSARARPQATVSMPLSWRQLPKTSDPADFTIQTVPAMLRHSRNPWKGFFDVKQKLPAAAR